MRRRKMWRFVGRSGFAVACISLVFFGMSSRWRFGFHGSWAAVGAENCFAYVGIGDFSPGRGWIWEPGSSFVLDVRPFFRSCGVYFPLIDVALLGAACGFVGWNRGRPIPEGFCQVCSYDFTGNVSGTCPECGTPKNDTVQPSR